MLKALDYLGSKNPPAPPAVIILAGDESFLIHEILQILAARILQGEDAEFNRIVFEGSKRPGPLTEWRTVADELHTVSLFGSGPRMVVVQPADDFVSEYREELEKHVARPGSDGVLILVVKSCPSNTKLYKAVDQSGLIIECKAPDEAVLTRWLTRRAEEKHGAKLPVDAAEQLVEIVGPDLGRLDQEIEKLALIAIGGHAIDENIAEQSHPTITRQAVIDTVGGWRAKTAWELSDRMCFGDTAVALEQLGRLIDADEEPIPILAQISTALRRYAAVTRLADIAGLQKSRVDIKSMLQETGMKIWPEALQKAEGQLKQLTRQRGRKLYKLLLEADQLLKGSHSSGHKSRLVLEQLIVRLGKEANKLTR